jgi:hypothetical protein
VRLRVPRRIAERLLGHTIQHRSGQTRNRCPVVGECLDVEPFLLARLARQPGERGSEAQVIEHARMDRVREGPHLLERFGDHVANRRDALVQHGGLVLPRGDSQLEHDCGEHLRRRVVQLAGDAGALLVLRVDHLRGEPADAGAVGSQIVEQRVQRRPHARHVAVGEGARRDARLEVARRHPRRSQLEIAQRTEGDVDEPEVDDQAHGKGDAEDRNRVAGEHAMALGHDNYERGGDNEQVGPDQLAE